MFKIAIIGPGNIAHTYMQALEKSDIAKVSAVLGTNLKKTKDFADKYGISYYIDDEEMYNLEKLDGVLICTPTFTHKTIVEKAISKKVNIMCEKPFVLDALEAESLFDKARENNIKIMVMQVVRFWPQYCEVKKIIDRKITGNITNVYLNRLSAHPDWCEWHKDPSKSGGGLYDLHIHDIDWLYFVFGKVKSVYAVGQKSNSGCWNNVSSVINFENGISAVAEGFMDMTGEWPFSVNIRINGTEAAVEYLSKKSYTYEGVNDSDDGLYIYRRNSKVQSVVCEKYNPYKAEVEYFADCVDKGKTIEIISDNDVVYVLNIIKAIEKSLQTGLIQYI